MKYLLTASASGGWLLLMLRRLALLWSAYRRVKRENADHRARFMSDDDYLDACREVDWRKLHRYDILHSPRARWLKPLVCGLMVAAMLLLSQAAWAATHVAASASYADVNTAYGLCSSGDTLVIPAGTETWTTQLTITIGIIVQGNGIGSTVITSGISDTSAALICYEPSSPGLDESFDLTGITFQGGGRISGGVLVVNDELTPLTKIRIWECRFYQCMYAGLKISGGPIYGVAWNCDFEDNYLDWEVIGADQLSFDNITASFGDGHAFFLEDSTFSQSEANFENSNGAQFVFRHNASVNWDVSEMMDVHGNNAWPVDAPDYTSPTRTIMNGEIYANTWVSIRSGSGHKWLYDRGGAILMYDNAITGPSVNSYVQVDEEDVRYDYLIPAEVLHNGTHYRLKQDITSSTETMEPGVGATWTDYWDVVTTDLPTRDLTWGLGRNYKFSTSYDPIFDTYFYNNTENSADIGDPYVVSPVGDYIIYGTNYKMQDPRGQTIKGHVYQPYTYPHPLRGESGHNTRLTLITQRFNIWFALLLGGGALGWGLALVDILGRKRLL
jgi:cbb3-type cytochrome oxidase subunit 3